MLGGEGVRRGLGATGWGEVGLEPGGFAAVSPGASHGNQAVPWSRWGGGGLTPAPSPHLPRHGWGRPHGAPLQHLRSLPRPLLPLRRARLALPGEAEVSAGIAGRAVGLQRSRCPSVWWGGGPGVAPGAGPCSGHCSVPYLHLCGHGGRGTWPSQQGSFLPPLWSCPSSVSPPEATALPGGCQR